MLIIAGTLMVSIVGAAGDSPTVIQSKDVLAHIATGEPVAYDGVVIEGDLNLSGVDLPAIHIARNEFEKGVYYLSEEARIVDSPISIKNSEIKGVVNFDNAIFKNIVYIKNNKFDKCVYLQAAQFDRDVDFELNNFSNDAFFEWSQFHGEANFDKTNFGGNCHFLEAQFNGSASYKNVNFTGFPDFRSAKFRGSASFGCSFNDNAYFEQAHFLEDADFKNANFGGFAGFWSAKFDGDADFRGSHFNGDAYFWNGQFDGETLFSDARFENYADFRGADFAGNVDFSYTQFNKKADFWNSQFNKKADFWNTRFREDASFENAQFSDSRDFMANFLNAFFDGNVSFVDAKLSPICDFRSSRFSNRLNLTGSRFDCLRLGWADIKDNLSCDEPVYIALVKNFENLGQFEDADNCFYQYRRYRQEISKFGLSKYIDIAAWVTCGYGVRPHYTIVWSLFLVLIFGLIFYRANAIQRSDTKSYSVIYAPGYNKRIWNITIMEALHYSALVFFVSLPPQDWRPIGRWKYFVFFEDVIGWIFITLFVVTLGHIMIR